MTNPPKICSTCNATFHTSLTFGPNCFFISFYQRSPCPIILCTGLNVNPLNSCESKWTSNHMKDETVIIYYNWINGCQIESAQLFCMELCWVFSPIVPFPWFKSLVYRKCKTKKLNQISNKSVEYLPHELMRFPQTSEAWKKRKKMPKNLTMTDSGVAPVSSAYL